MMMKVALTRSDIDKLKDELQRIRQRSLEASRHGDFRTVARLTCEAARLNQEINQAEGVLAAA
jgi:vacuolar-type H+-ATPase subunit D/Vma8